MLSEEDLKEVVKTEFSKFVNHQERLHEPDEEEEEKPVAPKKFEFKEFKKLLSVNNRYGSQIINQLF